MPREAFERQFCATGAPKGLFKAIRAHPRICREPGRSPLKICLAEGKTEARGQTPAGLRRQAPANVSGRYLVLRVLRRKDTTTAGAKGGTEAPGRHQGGRKGLIGQVRGTREAGQDQLDSLGGTREAGKDLRTREAGKDQWTTYEAPGRH